MSRGIGDWEKKKVVCDEDEGSLGFKKVNFGVMYM